MFKVSSYYKDDKAFWTKLHALIRDPSWIDELYTMLMGIDLAGWKAKDTRPFTEAYRLMQRENTPNVYRWLRDLLFTGEIEALMLHEWRSGKRADTPGRCLNGPLFTQMYKDWCTANHYGAKTFHKSNFNQLLLATGCIELEVPINISKRVSKYTVVYETKLQDWLDEKHPTHEEVEADVPEEGKVIKKCLIQSDTSDDDELG